MQTVPSKSVAIGKQLGHVTARSPGEFEVESRNAADRPSKLGGDQVTVKFSAPASSTVTNVTELPEGRYKVEYTAPNPGTYQLTVKMNGEHIVGSPFKLVATVPRAQADMCTVQGKALSQLTAGEIGSFTISFIDRLGSNAPPAELDIRVKPEGVPIPGPDDPVYVPPRVKSTFDSFDKDGSGDIDFTELRQALELLGMGGDRKAAAVLLRRYDSDGGGLQIEEFAQLVADMEMATSTGYLLHGVSATNEKSVRSVSYEVKVAGKYDVHVAFAAASGGGVLTGSPFRLRVVPSKASAEQTELPASLLNGLKTAVGESGEFALQAFDQYRNACGKGGDKVKVSSIGALSAQVRDLGNGTYTISYTCNESGVHRMAIAIGDSQVRGSPLAVTCEPGPLDVQSCELLHSGDRQSTTAGTPIVLTIRARDRFGNATANVSVGVGFTVRMRHRAAGDIGGVGSSGGEMGRLEACEGTWRADGMYELVYVPASRGDFIVQVVCVREPLGEIEEVAGFVTMALEVQPLGPEAAACMIANGERWQGAKLPAGTRLFLTVELRDRFGNPCTWAADHYADSPCGLPLAASMTKLGVVSGKGLSSSEADVHPLHVFPRNEAIGSYECRHVLVRTGRCSIAFTLGGKQVGGSPIALKVIPARPSGIKSRLELPSTKERAARRVSKEHGSGNAPASEARSADAAGGEGGATAIVGQPFRIELHMRDAYGNRVETGGAAVDLAVVEPPVIAGSEFDHILAAKLESSVEDAHDGSYIITLIAARPGEHVVTLRVDHAEVIGSPMTLTVNKPRILLSTKAAGKSRGETLFVVATAISNAGLNWAFKAWDDYSLEKRDTMSWLRSVASSLVHMDLKVSFNTWVLYAAEVAQIRQKLKKTLVAIQSDHERKGFTTWQFFTSERKRKVEMLRRSIAVIMSVQLLAAFNTCVHLGFGLRWMDSIDLNRDVDESYVSVDNKGSQGSSFKHSTSFLKRREKRLSKEREKRLSEEEMEAEQAMVAQEQAKKVPSPENNAKRSAMVDQAFEFDDDVDLDLDLG